MLGIISQEGHGESKRHVAYLGCHSGEWCWIEEAWVQGFTHTWSHCLWLRKLHLVWSSDLEEGSWTFQFISRRRMLCGISPGVPDILSENTGTHTHTEAHAYTHTHRHTHNSCGSYPVFSGVQQDTTHFSGPFPAKQKPSKEVVVLGCRVGLGPYKGLLFAAAASGVTSSLPGSLPTLGKVCYPLGIDLAGSVSIALALWARALLLKTWGEGRE